MANISLYLFILASQFFLFTFSFGHTLAAVAPHPQAGFEILSEVSERCKEGVVNISSTRIITTRDTTLSPFFNDPFFQQFFGGDFPTVPRKRREQSLGSGVIVSADGLVLTSSHVVEGAQEIVVTLADKRELKAKIVGTDPRSDVAVIRLQGEPVGLQSIPLGNSAELRLGEVVLAIGNPFGLSHTVTMGIVSAKGRADVGIVDYEDFIQTDAAINPGNSGGALINLRGELVGVNTAILSRSGGYQGIGFAIPVNLARAVMDSLVRSGKVVRGWLGAGVQDLDTQLAEALHLESVQGVLVSEVLSDSPAAAAGLKRGDVIRKLNGERMDKAERFRTTVSALGAGTGAVLEVSRDGAPLTMQMTIAEAPRHHRDEAVLGKNAGKLGGLSVAPVDELARQKFELPARLTGGVVITEISPDSPAADSGLRIGDVILELNRQEVKNVGDFEKLYRAAAKKELALLVYRDGQTGYLVLRR
ncbi:MAG TPA: DegQ family serine endoprotease [Desulfurivibrionaceae bacterium]|nr:DegQ family serine endoprotease [Desulfurivibrionaceae bacterium]